MRHIIIKEQFPDLSNGWLAESYQRERIIDGLYDATDEDYIFFSDSDEIPNPKILENFSLKKNMQFYFRKCMFIK